MELIHNRLIKIIGRMDAGIYRVIHKDAARNLVYMVCLERDIVTSDQPLRGRKPKLGNNPRKSAPQIGAIVPFDNADLTRRIANQEVLPFEQKVSYQYLMPLSEPNQKIFDDRVNIMRDFLHLPTLANELEAYRSLAPLMNRVCQQQDASLSSIKKYWSELCKLGITEDSLRPRYFRCGARGVKRPCDPGGRKKAGAKTTRERLAKKTGVTVAQEQLGMSTEWRLRILAADRTLPTPRPKMPERCLEILRIAFMTQGTVDAQGQMTLELPAKGQYPNKKQIIWILKTEIPRLEQILLATTKGHFLRNDRGMKGRAWQDVAGPGGTWAIDSTVGDVYLRSSVNRNWLVGRPIVYILVDVWSTAVVGFYVCLSGPSWDMAKQALFSAAVCPELLGKIWGYQPVLSLKPAPTLCSTLLCDRGEYLSQGARHTGLNLLPNQSFTPPYRPDLKSLAEVLHRIEKDQQFQFLPGAIDARRAELELRRFDPRTASFTIRSYTQYLHLLFSEYNLTADRRHRLDAGMTSVGVLPTPAGLWKWGHDMGIGVQRKLSQDNLIPQLLPADWATVTPSGVQFGGLTYQSSLFDSLEWQALARNTGRWKIPIHYFTGSMQQIWTPNPVEGGMLAAQMSDHSNAHRTISLEEWVDVLAIERLQRSGLEHLLTKQRLMLRKKRHELIAQEKQLTQLASLQAQGPEPTMTEARQIENMIIQSEIAEGKVESSPLEEPNDAGVDLCLATMSSVLEAVFGDEK